MCLLKFNFLEAHNSILTIAIDYSQFSAYNIHCCEERGETSCKVRILSDTSYIYARMPHWDHGVQLYDFQIS